jgi:hypothetical protein
VGRALWAICHFFYHYLKIKSDEWLTADAASDISNLVSTTSTTAGEPTGPKAKSRNDISGYLLCIRVRINPSNKERGVRDGGLERGE